MNGHVLLLPWCLITTLFQLSTSVEVPLVETAVGEIQGTLQTTYGGKHVYAYLGIPYGAPPIGEERFRRPKPAKPWKGVLNATSNPVMCPQHEYPFAAYIPFLQKWQILTNLSEDCLYLSVWTPVSKPQQATVMVWIHGGAFTKGGISFPLYNGGSLAAEENVIVVAMNYRLSVLGFLYLDDDELPGNAGLYDQLLALQWVRDNIAAFGGDPNSITVFGESSGATNAGQLLLSPKNDIFKKAIMESGSPDVPWATHNKVEAKKRAMAVAKYVGCSEVGNASAIVKCLRGKNFSDLLEAEPQDPRGVAVAPVVDGELIVVNGSEPGEWSDRRILLGTNANEGTLFFLNFFVSYINLFTEELFVSENVFLDFLRKEAPNHEKEGTVERVALFYANEVQPNYTNSALDNIISDLQFTCPTHMTAYSVAKSGGHAYMYRYTNRASYSLFPKWLGVFHSHEMEVLFGQPLDPKSNYSPDDRIFSKQIGRFWANFARTGNPNKSPADELPINLVSWPEYTVDKKEYLTLSANGSYADRDLRFKYCVFWEDVLPYGLKYEKAARINMMPV